MSTDSADYLKINQAIAFSVYNDEPRIIDFSNTIGIKLKKIATMTGSHVTDGGIRCYFYSGGKYDEKWAIIAIQASPFIHSVPSKGTTMTLTDEEIERLNRIKRELFKRQKFLRETADKLETAQITHRQEKDNTNKLTSELTAELLSIFDITSTQFP